MTRELVVVDSPGGIQPHLADAATLMDPDASTLCGNMIGRPSRTWFALAGCKRCARSALCAGDTALVDVDGEEIDLAEVPRSL